MSVSSRLSFVNVVDFFLVFLCWLFSLSALSYYSIIVAVINCGLSVGSVASFSSKYDITILRYIQQ